MWAKSTHNMIIPSGTVSWEQFTERKWTLCLNEPCNYIIIDGGESCPSVCLDLPVCDYVLNWIGSVFLTRYSLFGIPPWKEMVPTFSTTRGGDASVCPLAPVLRLWSKAEFSCSDSQYYLYYKPDALEFSRVILWFMMTDFARYAGDLDYKWVFADMSLFYCPYNSQMHESISSFLEILLYV